MTYIFAHIIHATLEQKTNSLKHTLLWYDNDCVFTTANGEYANAFPPMLS